MRRTLLVILCLAAAGALAGLTLASPERPQQNGPSLRLATVARIGGRSLAAAVVGDHVYVSGTLGDAAGALAILRGEWQPAPEYVQHLLDRFRADTFDSLDRHFSSNPILHSFQWVVHEYQIDRSLIEAFLLSMENPR